MSQYTDKAKKHMDKCLEALQANFSRVRTGRANPHILTPLRSTTMVSQRPSRSLPA